MLKVVGEVACDGTLVERDPWIALKVSWLPRISVQPLYVQISGSNGGEIELKVDLISGSLYQAILLLSPQSSLDVPKFHMVNDGRRSATPVIDRHIWEDGRDLSDWVSMQGSFVSLAAVIGLERADNGMRISFNESIPSSFIRAGNVEVGCADDGELASITALCDLW
jgi:hypothetical protein